MDKNSINAMMNGNLVLNGFLRLHFQLEKGVKPLEMTARAIDKANEELEKELGAVTPMYPIRPDFESLMKEKGDKEAHQIKIDYHQKMDLARKAEAERDRLIAERASKALIESAKEVINLV